MTTSTAPTPRHDGAAGRPPLAKVAALTAKLHDIDHQRQVAIHSAITSGASWAQVAAALGVTAQAAHKRYRWLHHSPATGETWQEPPLSC